MNFCFRAKFFLLCAEFMTTAFLYAIVFLTTQVVLWGLYNMNAVQGYDSQRNVLEGVGPMKM